MDDVDAFVAAKRDSVVADINAMHAELGRQGKVPEGVITRVVDSLKDRLRKAQTASFVPTLSYSTISFASTESALVSPWGQAYSFLSDIAKFPREALTDSYFWRGVRVREDALIEAMNVAEDALCRDLGSRGIKDRCRAELNLLSKIEKAPSTQGIVANWYGESLGVIRPNPQCTRCTQGKREIDETREVLKENLWHVVFGLSVTTARTREVTRG